MSDDQGAPAEVLDYLDNLRSSGVTNMYGAAPYVEDEFGVERDTARQWLQEWMRTFSTRHPRGAA